MTNKPVRPVIPPKPPKAKFTDQQWQSIYDGGNNLLVSASAGSGKTTVLVQRVIEKVKSGTDIDRLLIVTFTEAAAREMKERIQEALQEAVNKEPDSSIRAGYTRQLTLLPQANISTLHAFCLTVIRRFYFLIHIDPVFRMLTDETERYLLQEEVWTELREEYYANEDRAFFELAENFGSDRSDEGLTDLIMKLYSFATANPDPQAWLQGLADNYDVKNGFEQNPLYQSQIKPTVAAALNLAIDSYQVALELAQREAKLAKDADSISQQLTQAQNLLQAIEKDDMSAFFAQKENLDLKLLRKKTGELADFSLEVKGVQEAGKIAVEEAVSFFQYPKETIDQLMKDATGLVKKMSEVTAKFMAGYQARKLQKGVLDFNDLEHLTLQILTTQQNGQPSPAATYYLNKFDEVMVDEYQDVNRLQEAILYQVRQTGNDPEHPGNMFMVGDVKQSIYAFRLADPTLFIEKYLDFAAEKGGERIVLAENFRSRREVLDFTNLVFQQLMDERVGQIPYDEAATLIPGFPNFPESQDFDTEILLFEKGKKNEDRQITSKTVGELQMVAIKIREMLQNGFEIYDKKLGENRLLTYKDIVLLAPTRSNNQDIIDIFGQYDIPLEINDTENYFKNTELQVMISLLKIIDNPYDDIPLAAVLRSPIVGLQEEELAQIRLADRKNDYFMALQRFIRKQTGPLQEKLQRFADQLERWRDLSRKVTLTELIWDIYDETAYLDYVLGMAAGSQRYANLVALVNRAKQYEAANFRGLYQFIRLIEKMQERDLDLAEPAVEAKENAVRMMTIHGSKGLEFPIVFLLDMSKDMNQMDTNQKYVFEEKLGAGIKYIDQERRVIYETMPYQAIKQLRQQKAYSEEMRKLYVALTRAEQKLFLIGSYESREKALAVWQNALTQDELVLNPTLRMKGSGLFMNWVGMTLMRHPDMERVFEEAKDRRKTIQHPAHFKIEWFDETILAEREGALGNSAQLTAMNTEAAERVEPEQLDLFGAAAMGVMGGEEPVDLELIRSRLDYQYQYPKATLTTAYQSVSEIKRVFEDPDDVAAPKLAWQSETQRAQTQAYRFTSDRLATPRFLGEKADGAAVGTATHTVLQLLPLDQVPDETFLKAFVEKLVTADLLDEKAAAKIDFEKIIWFFNTQLGQQLLATPEKVRRERPFAMLKGADTIFGDYDQVDDQLLIHGIIDGYVETPAGIILYDFKTDHVIPGQEEKVAARYRGQLNLYKQALTEATGQVVVQSCLILLEPQLILTY